jgi:hypothetical protein
MFYIFDSIPKQYAFSIQHVGKGGGEKLQRKGI